jgi:putative transposase
LLYVPRVILTDKLKSDGAAKREILPGVEHRQSRSLNNRCENSPRPTRQRERRMQGLKSSASDYRQEMRKRVESWAEITGTTWAA